MTKKEQLEIERQRRETALKNTFFTAIFFYVIQ
jgi:hypothetical protein